MWIKNVKLDNGDPDMIWVEPKGTAGDNMHNTEPSRTAVPDMTFKGNYITIPQSEYDKLLDIEHKFHILTSELRKVMLMPDTPYEGNTW